MRSPGHGGEGREAILEAAEQLFVRYGFKKTSIDDVARAARIGKGSVYLHFASKEELFAEVVRGVMDRLLEALSSAVRRARTPAARLRAFLAAELTTVAAMVAEYRLTEETLMELLPLAAAVRERYAARERELLEGILREGVESGAFAVEHPGRLAATIMIGLTSLQITSPARLDDPEVRAGLDDFLAFLVRGLSRDPR